PVGWRGPRPRPLGAGTGVAPVRPSAAGDRRRHLGRRGAARPGRPDPGHLPLRGPEGGAMRAPVAVFLAATLAGALAVLAVADANGAAFLVTIAVAGVVVATIGGALGRSQVVCAGA